MVPFSSPRTHWWCKLFKTLFLAASGVMTAPEVSMSMDMLLLPLGTHEPYMAIMTQPWPSHGPSWPPGTPSIPGSLRPCRFAGPLFSWREPWSQAGLTRFDMDCWDCWDCWISTAYIYDNGKFHAESMKNLWRIYGILFIDMAKSWQILHIQTLDDFKSPDSAGIICWYLLPVQMYHHLPMSSKKRISKSPGTQDHTPTAVMASPQPLGWKIDIYLYIYTYYTHTHIYIYVSVVRFIDFLSMAELIS